MWPGAFSPLFVELDSSRCWFVACIHRADGTKKERTCCIGRHDSPVFNRAWLSRMLSIVIRFTSEKVSSSSLHNVSVRASICKYRTGEAEEVSGAESILKSALDSDAGEKLELPPWPSHIRISKISFQMEQTLWRNSWKFPSKRREFFPRRGGVQWKRAVFFGGKTQGLQQSTTLCSYMYIPIPVKQEPRGRKLRGAAQKLPTLSPPLPPSCFVSAGRPSKKDFLRRQKSKILPSGHPQYRTSPNSYLQTIDIIHRLTIKKFKVVKAFIVT